MPASVRNLQYEGGQEPSLEAMRTRSRVVVQDLTAEQRWEEWPQAAVADGIYGVRTFPLEAFDEVIGGLTLYAHRPDVFPEPVQQIAAQFVRPAALLLAGVLRHLSQAELIARLRAALTSRGVVDQAVGIVMAHGRCSPDEAFSMLRKISNDRNIKVRALTTELITAVATGAPAPTWAPFGGQPGPGPARRGHGRREPDPFGLISGRLRQRGRSPLPVVPLR